MGERLWGGRIEVFPFIAVMGMEAAKNALLWLAVDPGLKGVLIEASPGTAKSLLVRGFAAMLPDRESPFVEAPCGVLADQLFGGLDLERTFATGKIHVTGGLLARAERGFLYIDEVNLLTSAPHIAAALDGFALIGTYDPREGAVNTALMEAVGILVREEQSLSTDERVEMLERVKAFDRNPAAFRAQYGAESLRECIEAARDLLPHVDVTTRDCQRLSEANSTFTF
jgi:magnesium chelatase subunit D